MEQWILRDVSYTHLEVIGAYLAEELTAGGFPSNNKHKSFYVITPEFDNTGQMVVRNNIQPMIKGKNVLVVLATAMSGHTISKAIGTILAHGGKVTCLLYTSRCV